MFILPTMGVKSKYHDTLNLPKTAFPMKADLPRREPKQIEKWVGGNLYQQILKKNTGRPLFVLHDGPPYANGHIHYGHILNKILKDFVVKYKNLSGSLAPLVPGWDCHGLPIEHEVEKELEKSQQALTALEVRQACREYAEKYFQIQRREFQRLGILADWEAAYRTMDAPYEAVVARQLLALADKGMVYRGKKPVFWSTACKTAVAEAEIEYRAHRSPSLYLKFKPAESIARLHPEFADKPVYFVVWTTTPWTLPGNEAIAVNANYTYSAVLVGEEILLVAEARLEALRSILNFQEDRLVERIPGKRLEGIKVQHPFLDRAVPIVTGRHVTLEIGTGIVHIAPGHGAEDYEVGRRYRLPVLSPIDEQGRFTDECGVKEWTGRSVFDCNDAIIERLKENKALLKSEEIEHQYPYCWRSQTPLVFRSTPQYFFSLQKEDLKGRILETVRKVRWIPPGGRERFYQMVQSQSDWCLSRQRSWGVPLFAFICGNCGHSDLEPAILKHLVARIEKEGSDVFYKRPDNELLPEDFTCPQCKKKDWKKQTDILDVWFESGSSWAAVLESSPHHHFPADLYLEGTDQHRGWFQASLLLAMANRGEAPYRSVLTHGFVVDGEGKKLSKSSKNYQPPEGIFQTTGAELLRWWAASEDYSQDIRFSQEILDRLKESYRKIRNTLRFILGNLCDYNPRQNAVPFRERSLFDRWVLGQMKKFQKTWVASYEAFHFHRLYHSMNRFFTVTLSATYLDIIKDTLYTHRPGSVERRASQSTLFEISMGILPYLAPLLSFTAEEAWAHLPPWEGKESSIFLTDLPAFPQEWENRSLEETMEKTLIIRQEAHRALETAKDRKIIQNPLEAQVWLKAEEDWLKFLQQHDKSWAEYLQVSQAVVVYDLENPQYRSERIIGLEFEIRRAEGRKCERCWHYSITVGKNPLHPTLCQRCGEIV